jgi:chemotaxis protein MotA
MDLMSIIGWGVGIVLVLISIALVVNKEEGTIKLNFKLLKNFFDIPSIAIVVGGTICSLMVSFPLSFFKRIGKHFKVVLFPTKYDPVTYIDQLVTFAKEARMNGLLAIEDKLSETKDIFLKNSLMLVVDSVEPEKVNTLLETELDYFDARHSQDMEFYLKGSDYSPAFGMIGTLIGLINLLKNLTNQDALVANMAVALITTFYGSLLSNFFFKPIATKLKIRHDEELLCKTIIAEGVKAIQDGDNPNFIEEKLIRLLPAKVGVKRASEKS